MVPSTLHSRLGPLRIPPARSRGTSGPDSIISALLYPPSFFSIRVMGEPATRGSAETIRQSLRMSKGEYRFASSYPSLTRKRPLLYLNNSSSVAGLPESVSVVLRCGRWKGLIPLA
jgi:hypothetical protein